MIKKVNYNCFDIFFGKGWDNWVRMESDDGKSWRYKAGNRKFAKGAEELLQRKLKVK